MTDVTSGYQQPYEGEGKEQRRRVIEDALLAFRPEVERRFREWIGREVPSRGAALRNLAAATDVPRLLKHRLLIDVVRRSPEEDREALDEPVRDVLDSTLDQRLDPDTRRSLVDEARLRLDEVAAAPGDPRLQAQHWEQWVSTTESVFRFSTHEATFQACNDEEAAFKVTAGGQLVQSRLIVCEFWSDWPPTSFAKFIDPLHWPECSSFWQAMRELRPPTPTDGGYDCDLEETVKTFNETLIVPLEVGFRTRPDRSRVWTRFNIARGFYSSSVPVDVDTGTVSAESMPGGPAKTLVRSTKYLHWSDPNRPDFTSLACDFGWSEHMVEMAYACREQVPHPETAPSAATVETSIDDAIRTLVEDVATECRNGITTCMPHAEKLIGRFTGRSWDAGWINDLLAMELVTVRRYSRVASRVRRFADSLRDADDRGEKHE
jgi:hypothetical protein